MRTWLLLISIALGGCSDRPPTGKSSELQVVFGATVDPATGAAISISRISLRDGPEHRARGFNFGETRDEKTGHITEQMVFDGEHVPLASAKLMESGKSIRVSSNAPGVNATLEAEGFQRSGVTWQESGGVRYQSYGREGTEPPTASSAASPSGGGVGPR